MKFYTWYIAITKKNFFRFIWWKDFITPLILNWNLNVKMKMKWYDAIKNNFWSLSTFLSKLYQAKVLVSFYGQYTNLTKVLHDTSSIIWLMQKLNSKIKCLIHLLTIFDSIILHIQNTSNKYHMSQSSWYQYEDYIN